MRFMLTGVLLACGLSATGCAAGPQPATPAHHPSGVAETHSGQAATAAAPAVDLRDPVSVARRYITERWTYRWDNELGVLTALTAANVTTPRFAAASRPSELALRRLLHAQDAVTVTITNAGVFDEAPNTPTTRFIAVGFTRHETYVGAPGPQPDPAVWTLRLVKAGDGWRVDGVEDGQ